MARAVLEIHADGSAIRRVFGEVIAESARASSAISGEWKKVGDSMADSLRRARAEVGASLAAIRRHEKAVTQTQSEESQRRRQLVAVEGGYRDSAFRETEQAAGRAEEAITRNQERQGRRRVSFEQQVAREQERIHRQLVVAREREAQQEARRQEQRRNAFGRGAAAVAGAVGTFGRTAHGAIQDSRERAASVERDVGDVVFQAGGSRADQIAMTRQLQQFAANTPGVDPGALAAGLRAAQTEFSVLGDRNTTAADREQRMREFLDEATLARDLGGDQGETARLSGLFRQQGFGKEQRRALILEATGLAQRGAIETGAITRQAMPAITARMNAAMAALGSDATPEQRQAAAGSAFRQAMAEIEVARGTQGTSAREAGNVLRNVNVRLGSDVVQQKALQNIRRVFGEGSELERALFEADPNRRGRSRLREQYRDALSLTQRFGEVAGNDPQLFQNVFTGGGHGNPMALLANERRILGNLLGADAEGKTGVSRVRELMQGSALTEADVRRGGGIFGQDQQAQLTQAQAQRDASLTDNTSAINRLSNTIRDWSTRNPLGSAALTGAAGLGTTLAGGVLANRAGGALAKGAGGLLGRAGGMLAGAGGAAAAAAPWVAGAAGAAVVGLGIGEGINRLIYNDRDRAQSATGGDTSILSGNTWRGFAQGMRDLFTGGLDLGVARGPDPTTQAAPVVAAVDRLTATIQQGIPTSPHDRSLQDGNAASAPGRTPPAP